jgi:hypothetical protein
MNNSVYLFIAMIGFVVFIWLNDKSLKEKEAWKSSMENSIKELNERIYKLESKIEGALLEQ